MTLEEQLSVLRKAQEHYEMDSAKEEAMEHNCYSNVEKSDEYASKGVAGSGLGLGIAGTALGLLNSGGLGFLGGRNCNGHNEFITRQEFELGQQLSAKDSEIGLLKADKYTDQKLVEVYNALNNKIDALKDAQYSVNLQQATLNATQTATISCMQSQIAQLQSLTKMVVPNTSVCPGWGNVTITPATTTTTTA